MFFSLFMKILLPKMSTLRNVYTPLIKLIEVENSLPKCPLFGVFTISSTPCTKDSELVLKSNTNKYKIFICNE